MDHSIRILGESKPMTRVFEQVSRAAPLDRPILVVGERGTGKELIAARLHYLSRRWDRPYVKINCGAFSEGILESELFGHEAGAFTGATKRQLGRFERAHGGSLFLDELGNLPLAAQERMLRVIEYGEFERVGGQTLIQIDTRLIAATNEHLPDRVTAGDFRGDLLDRLTFDVITLPPLRERGEDILRLAEFFGIQMASELGWITFQAGRGRPRRRYLIIPGRVMFENCAMWSSAIFISKRTPAHRFKTGSSTPLSGLMSKTAPLALQTSIVSLAAHSSDDLPLKEAIANLERTRLLDALDASRWHQARAAERLGLSYHQMRALLRKYPDIKKP